MSRLWKVIPEGNLDSLRKQDFRIYPLLCPSNQNFYEVQLAQIHLFGGQWCIIHARFRSLWPQTKLGLAMRYDLWAPCCRAPSSFTFMQRTTPGRHLGHGETQAEPFGSGIVCGNNSSSVCDRAENGMKWSGIHCFQLAVWCLVAFLKDDLVNWDSRWSHRWQATSLPSSKCFLLIIHSQEKILWCCTVPAIEIPGVCYVTFWKLFPVVLLENKLAIFSDIKF